MEKLEIKHLAGYLPYGLKIRVEDYRNDYVGREFDKVIGLHQWDKSGLLWSVLTEGGAKPGIDKVKPILRPLSDLTKEIEVGGEKFVPLNKLAFTNNLKMYQFIDGAFYSLNYAKYLEIKEMPYIVVEKLLEWHFDIHGLIEKNLAIDINTL